MQPLNKGILREKIIPDFKSLIDRLFSYDEGYVFRGQRDAKWPLESTLVRSLKSTENVPEFAPVVERTINDVLNSRIHHYIHRDETPKSNLGWHAIAQHHGAPTRLSLIHI